MPLAEDRIRALERRAELPEGNPASLGARVTYAGTDEDGDDIFDLTSDPDEEIRSFTGDPNDVVFAAMGTLGVERDVPSLWINSDGLAAWTPVGGAAASPPTDWVEWDIPSNEGPYAWNSTEQEVTWTDDIANATHGSAITLTSGHAQVAEDGWYTVYGYVGMRPVTTTTVYDFARLRLRGASSPQFTIGSDFLDWPDIVTELRPSNGQSGSTSYKASLPFHWTGYLVSGSPIQIYAQMSAAANPGSDWQVFTGLFNMLKLPM